MNYDWIELSDKTLFRKRKSLELSAMNRPFLVCTDEREETTEYKEYLKKYNKRLKTYNTVSEFLLELPFKICFVIMVTFMLLLFSHILFGVIIENIMVMIISSEFLIFLASIIIGYPILLFYKYPVNNFEGQKYVE